MAYLYGRYVFDRNTKIKDFMRDLCISQIVQSWWTILAAVRAVSALIQKGMPPSKKLSLVTALTDVMRNNNLINVNPNSDYEDVLRAGSLLSSVGSVLIDTYHK
ncbi:hypothetical protein TELCIR_20210 [Teladorsagia circumcincta]|uniref:Exportin-T n=1 Tax=Teladorsagia circumcincta TaxID=45464 RepID=A0A2G9TK68_TELCI|nr:hypothetical protein TELCIR_20210 [Teladorsagia circumcincta]